MPPMCCRCWAWRAVPAWRRACWMPRCQAGACSMSTAWWRCRTRPSPCGPGRRCSAGFLAVLKPTTPPPAAWPTWHASRACWPCRRGTGRRRSTPALPTTPRRPRRPRQTRQPAQPTQPTQPAQPAQPGRPPRRPPPAPARPQTCSATPRCGRPMCPPTPIWPAGWAPPSPPGARWSAMQRAGCCRVLSASSAMWSAAPRSCWCCARTATCCAVACTGHRTNAPSPAPPGWPVCSIPV